MPYATSNPPRMTAQAVAGTKIWMYSSTDPSTDVDATGYFTNGYDLGMRVGDVVFVVDSDTSTTQTTHSVITSTVGGASTISVAT